MAIIFSSFGTEQSTNINELHLLLGICFTIDAPFIHWQPFRAYIVIDVVIIKNTTFLRRRDIVYGGFNCVSVMFEERRGMLYF